MASGRLYQTDNATLQWVFLNPDTGLYLAGFGDRSNAEKYGGIMGYAVDNPETLTMAELNEMQPIGHRPTVNSPIPTPLTVVASNPDVPRAEASGRPAIRRFGVARS